ncbi:MAG: hypothetical protein QM572_19410 [Nocardioides sp.]|uniref:hypothetical protein n=1 Tax=Nocardioides sp. TaxID=35761 RepID=UPI0039E47E6D
MALGGPTCRRCRRRKATRTNIMGEPVCSSCATAVTGAAAGMLSGGGSVTSAVSGRGALTWIRRALKVDRSG